MKIIILGSLLCFSLNTFATPAGDLNLNASSLKFKVYKMAVSTSADCSNPVIVINNGSTPVEADIKANPTFGTGSIENGTYPCIMFEVSDTIKYKGEASASGNCSPSVETSRDLCRLDNGGTSQLIDGTAVTCTDSEDRVALYVSTFTDPAATGNGFVPPTSAGSMDGANLTSALIVTGTTVGNLIVNTDGFLCDNQNDSGSDCDGAGSESAGAAACHLEGAIFGFSND